MEFITLLLVAVILYLLISYKNVFTKRMEALQEQLSELQRQVQKGFVTHNQAKEEKPAPAAPPVAKAPDPVFAIPPPLPQTTTVPQPATTEHTIREAAFTNVPPQPARSTAATRKQAPPAEPQLSFFERHPDLEKFIGENLVNKIGIAILVLAIGFFVKYAIDKEWIGEAGRAGIGILCGSILIGIAHRLRNNYKAFSSVLVGGGIAVFYFTITLAYHQFHLFGQTPSFIILIVITGFAVLLSLLYNRQELSVIALIGGLASPFMVSSGQANYQALFIYLVILNAGLLIIAYNKSWRILNIAAFALTVMVYAAALFTMPETGYPTGFLFASILYILFFSINIANNIKENKAFIAADFSILLSNTALYFAAGMYLLYAMHYQQFQGLFSATLATVNLVISYLLFKSKKADTNILYLLIGITLTFISLSAPIQLHGHYITIFWAAEAVMLYWLFQKSGIKLMRLTSLVIWVAMLFSLLMDWTNIYGSYPNRLITVIANKGFITTLVSAISCWLLYILLNKDHQPEVKATPILVQVFKYAAFILLFMAGLLEINHQFITRYPDTYLNVTYLMLYIPAFALLFHLLVEKSAHHRTGWQLQVLILSLSVIAYLVSYYYYSNLQFNILVRHTVSGFHFAAHWAAAICIGVLLYRIILLCKNNLLPGQLQAATWALCCIIVLFLSKEISLACNALFYTNQASLHPIEAIYIRTGLPVLWGLLSFALMWLGMRNKVRTLRIISLTFFSITLIKLFAFDIRNITPGGKIAAFFSLGVLLLIISFMYQKVKKIIIEDEKPAED